MRYNNNPNGEELDELLLDVKGMLEQSGDEDDFDDLPNDPLAEIRPRTDETRVWLNREDSIIVGAAASAEQSAREYYRNEPVYVEEPEPIQHQPSIRAYNNDFADRNVQNAQKRKTQAQRAAQAQRMREIRQAEQARQTAQLRQQQAYNAPPVYREPEPDEIAYEETPRRRRRKRRGCGCGLTFLLVLALLLALVFGAVKLLGRFGDWKDRKSGISNILVAGVDKDGLRTDVLMMVSVNKTEKTYNLLSIPRDTLTNAPMSVPKINGAYGYYGCGEAGMEAVMDLIEECIGFRPDRYVLVDFEAVSQIVDVMGGIEFDVPMDMEVSGIELQEGQQILNGSQALTVARFRDGYAMADLKRVEVQRELISAAMDQWISFKGILKLPDAIQCVKDSMMTDLTLWHLASLALDLRGCEAGVNLTLPGEAKMIGDGSYFVLDAEAVVEMMNEYFNPHKRDITVGDLNIKVG